MHQTLGYLTNLTSTPVKEWPYEVKTSILNFFLLSNNSDMLYYPTTCPNMSMISKRAHSWWKLNAVQSALLHAPSDWIMWLDSDAYLIKPPNEILNNIKFNIIPFKNAICVDPVAYLTREYPISILPHPTSNFNLGVMLFNSTNVHSTTIFIKDLWNINESIIKSMTQ